MFMTLSTSALVTILAIGPGPFRSPIGAAEGMPPESATRINEYRRVENRPDIYGRAPLLLLAMQEVTADEAVDGEDGATATLRRARNRRNSAQYDVMPVNAQGIIYGQLPRMQTDREPEADDEVIDLTSREAAIRARLVMRLSEVEAREIDAEQAQLEAEKKSWSRYRNRFRRYADELDPGNVASDSPADRHLQRLITVYAWSQRKSSGLNECEHDEDGNIVRGMVSGRVRSRFEDLTSDNQLEVLKQHQAWMVKKLMVEQDAAFGEMVEADGELARITGRIAALKKERDDAEAFQDAIDEGMPRRQIRRPKRRKDG